MTGLWNKKASKRTCLVQSQLSYVQEQSEVIVSKV